MKTKSTSIREKQHENCEFKETNVVSYPDDSLVVVCSGIKNKFSDGMRDKSEDETFEGTVIDSTIEDYHIGMIVEDFPQRDFIPFYGKNVIHSEQSKKTEMH